MGGARVLGLLLLLGACTKAVEEPILRPADVADAGPQMSVQPEPEPEPEAQLDAGILDTGALPEPVMDAAIDAGIDPEVADSGCIEDAPCELGSDNGCVFGTLRCDSPVGVICAGTPVPEGTACAGGQCNAFGECLEADAGATDAGTVEADAGAPDAMLTVIDAGPPPVLFRGAYEVNDPGCNTCANGNALAGACACPADARVSGSLRVINDCVGAGTQHGANIAWCSNGAVSAGDFGGIFQVDDAVVGGRGCRSPNPATGACSCPAGASVIALRTLADFAPGRILGSNLGVCLRLVANVPLTTFGGAFQGDDGRGCRVANPATGACSCPQGFVDLPMRVQADLPGAFIGSVVHFCAAR